MKKSETDRFIIRYFQIEDDDELYQAVQRNEATEYAR